MPARNPVSLPFRLTAPVRGYFAPLVVDSPHSGSQLPADFEFICSLYELRQSEDSYVDHFARNVPKVGGTLLQALVNRAYIDLNRALADLHPDVCAEEIPWPIHRTRRSDFGIGLIRHLIRAGEPVYESPLPLAAIQQRINGVYQPYYEALETALNQAHAQAGRVVHINLHATPSRVFGGSSQPDIILGDHDGHSSARAYREWLKNAFEKQGLKVVINHPYKGVELTRKFGKPRQGYHSIQVEVNKALYMDENTLAVHDGKAELQHLFDRLWSDMAAWLMADREIKAAE